MARKFNDVRDNFSAGVVAPENYRNANLFATALKQGENIFITNAGTLMRRCGTTRLDRTGVSGRLVKFDLENGDVKFLVFTHLSVKIYDASAALEQTVTAVWVTADIDAMAIEPDKNELYIASNAFWPQALVFDGATWSVADFAFRTDPNGRRASPFTRFNEEGVTILPSAYTGTGITLTFSSPLLNSDYIGGRFLYAFGAQIEVTAITSSTIATADVIGTIFPTYTVTVTSGASYEVGDVVTGDTTSVQGQVVGIATNVLTIVNLAEHTAYVVGEKLSAPGGFSDITVVVQAGAPSATNIWFEELISDARGFPSTCTLHRTRLCFAGFPEAPNHFIASAIEAPTDFDVGDGSDSNAIIVEIGNNRNERLLHLISEEQLVILTAKRTMYVSETPQTPFTPSGISFDKIGTDIAGTVPPTSSTEGVLFIDVKDRVLLLSLTGTTRGAWATTELTQLGYENINAPRQLVFSAGIANREERVLTVLNGDGTAAVFTYKRQAQQAGWLKWSRSGSNIYHSFAGFNGELFCIAGNGTEINIEQFDFNAVMDAQFPFGDAGYPSESVYMLRGSHVVGPNTTDGSGNLVDPIVFASISHLGIDFPVTIEPAPWVHPQAGRLRYKIGKTWTDVIDSGTFRCNGTLQQGTVFSSDPEEVPPVTGGSYQANRLGSGTEQTSVITQLLGEGAPLHIRQITMKVSA